MLILGRRVGDSIVIDGFHQGQPEPSGAGIEDKWLRAFRYLSLDRMETRLHRWRLDLTTGSVTEERLSESFTEFGMLNPTTAATSAPDRASSSAMVPPKQKPMAAMRPASASCRATSASSPPRARARVRMGSANSGFSAPMAPSSSSITLPSPCRSHASAT